ncbi:MAG: glycosyltransferase family 2 protein [Prevotella sp.]|nr:glycosyltransferase family 2 protein [Prevotella sp.]
MHYDVTIGIPVYQAEDYIKKMMESALAQQYPSIEFLLIDDGCIDKSSEIIRDIKSTHPRGKDIHLLSHRQNQGVSNTRNQIIEEAQGEYLYFMDADDVIAENTISLLMGKAKELQADIVFGSYEKIELSGNHSIYQYPELYYDQNDNLANFAYRKYFGIQASACNFLVRLSILRENRIRFMDSKFWEDTVFVLELVTYIQKAVLLPDITYTYLCRPHSLTDIKTNKQIAKQEILQYFEAVEQLKQRKRQLVHKAYFPGRCYIAVMSDFYIICNILKRWQYISPKFSYRELKAYLKHPASLLEILSFKNKRLQNLMLYILGKLPATTCIQLIIFAGKRKGLI